MTDICGPTGQTTFGRPGVTFTGLCGQDTTGPVYEVSALAYPECITICADIPRCKAASWRDGTCYFKGAVGEIVPNEHVTSFIVTIRDGAAPEVPTLSCPADNGKEYAGFTVTCGTDYPGIGDIGSSIQPNLESCIDSCTAAADQGCISAVYNGHACYLKNKIGSATDNAGTIAVFKSGTTYEPPVAGPECPSVDGTTFVAGGQEYMAYCDREYYGGDLAFVHSDTFAECAATCASTTGCIDVSYRGTACYMKSKLTSLEAAPGVWTALFVGATSEPEVVEPGPQYACPHTGSRTYKSNGITFKVDCSSDYYGGDLAAVNAPTAEACMEACAANALCAGASYRGTGCYLKSTLGDVQVDEGVLGIERLERSHSNPECDEAKAFWGSHMGGGCSSGCYCNAGSDGGSFCVDDRASGLSCRSDADCLEGEFCDVGFPENRDFENGSYCSAGRSCSSTYGSTQPQTTKRGLLAIGGGSARVGMGRSVLKRDEFLVHGRNYVALKEIEAADNSTATSS